MKEVRFEGGKIDFADIIIEVRISVDRSKQFKFYKFIEHKMELYS